VRFDPSTARNRNGGRSRSRAPDSGTLGRDFHCSRRISSGIRCQDQEGDPACYPIEVNRIVEGTPTLIRRWSLDFKTGSKTAIPRVRTVLNSGMPALPREAPLHGSTCAHHDTLVMTNIILTGLTPDDPFQSDNFYASGNDSRTS